MPAIAFLSWALMAVGLATFGVLWWIAAPYGRFMRSGWGPTLPSRWGWMVMETPSATGFLAVYFLGARRFEDVPLVLLVMWQAHYLHRAYVFPWRLREHGKRMPWLIVGMGLVFNGVNTWLNARWISEAGRYDVSWLWDPSFVDPSWIAQPIYLIPRLQALIQQYYPGTKLGIGEWNFGGEGHMSGALAAAEALGRFAQFGVTSAFYWTHPPEGSPVIQGFLAYRNFDGKGGRFLDWYVPTTTADHVSLFASRDEAGKHMVLVAINMSAEEATLAKLNLDECGGVASLSSYMFVRGTRTLTPVPPERGTRGRPRPTTCCRRGRSP